MGILNTGWSVEVVEKAAVVEAVVVRGKEEGGQRRGTRNEDGRNTGEDPG